jgi:hypothetical protein
VKRADKEQWIAALRSGDYKQGKCQLYEPLSHSFCCLGVLCDLHGEIDGEGITKQQGSALPDLDFLA